MSEDLDGYCCLKHKRMAENARNTLGEPRDDLHVVGEFIEDALVLDPTKWTSSRRLYDTYGSWCRSNGHHPMHIQGFISNLRKILPVLIRKQTHNTVGYIGVELKEEHAEEQ